MRLTTVILLGTMLHLSAATFGQKLNYVNKNVSLEQLFKEIKKQTNYNVVWYEGKLNTARTINANFSNAPLDQVMDIALSGLPLTYTIRQNNIVIKEKTPSLLDKVISHFKNTTLFGKVNDEKGNPLPGATIRIKDTKSAVLSNKDGNFSIESKETSGILFISFLGYKPTEISFSPTNPGPFNITLKEDESILNEVVIISTGYQKISKEKSTGSFEQIDNQLINRKVSTSLLDRLKDVVPGIYISENLIPIKETATTPYSKNTGIIIRGKNTYNASTEPLIVLDNFPYEGDINNINPNDIESITILKDAAAASIWGARSGNGVIVITTKKGQQGQKMRIDFNSNLTFVNKPN
ncbi:SusC/RagA family TonB-linked outer membrane protein, partial [Pedobacter sp. HMWF019]|uniref:SusC/RagA family TonB-linked outer membrane protein n=1 Tax=Pedobacter sp. HMWF019 TaxID=2056856 RepID=UPI000D475552